MIYLVYADERTQEGKEVLGLFDKYQVPYSQISIGGRRPTIFMSPVLNNSIIADFNDPSYHKFNIESYLEDLVKRN